MEGIICLESDAEKISVASPRLDLFHKLLEQSRQPAQYMHNSVTWTSLNVQEILTQDLFTRQECLFYHKCCYVDIATITRIERAKKQYHDSIESS